MSEAAITGSLPNEGASPAPIRTMSWIIYQAAAFATLAFIIFEILGWQFSANVVAIASVVAAIPQVVTTYHLARVGRPAPSILLWLALVATCAAALGLALWASTRQFSDAILVGVVYFALAPAYLALWFGNWKSKEDRRWLVQGINLLSGVYAILIASVFAFGQQTGNATVSPGVVLAMMVVVVAQPLLACLIQAFVDHRLPATPGAKPQLKHISGLGAIFAALFTGSIAGLGIWAALGQNGFYIHREAGIVVAIGLAVVFLVVAIAPNFQTSDKIIRWVRNTRVIRFIGGAVSTLDGVLVFAFAGAMGTGQTNNELRYATLIANLLAAAFLGWWLPAPFGLLPIGWAFIGTLAVARRWAWVEEDRENAMLNRDFDGPNIKVGFEQDLRDETLFGFTALLILVPLALRQAHEAMGSHLFLVSPDANIDTILPWITFFGTELAKSVPFVDWAEVYQVQGDAPIRVDESSVGAAQHVIFATRVLVDLVLLAALVQALAVAQRASKLREMFYVERTINRLDPFVELKAFRNLVTGEHGAWQLVEPLPAPFRSYDEDRLEALQSKYADDPVGFAAGQILRTQSAELLLVEEAKLANPDATKMESYLERALSRGDDIAIEDLKAAHFILNDKGKHLGMREQIITVIADHWRADHAVGALCDVLMGEFAKDRRGEARLLALNGLHQPALNGSRDAQVAIRYASTHDAAYRVKDTASAWIAEHPDWGM